MSVVDEVKQRLDIVDVVAGYVQLTRSGQNFRAVCPFHSEKTPSFFVFPDRQTWHCFGACGAGGDVISFVMRAESLEFAEALRRLADRAGVTLPSRSRAEASQADRLLAVNEAAAAHYHRLLTTLSAAEPARRYLASRGLKETTLAEFGLGYCPPMGSGLPEHLRQQGFTMDEAVAAGVIIKVEGEWPERFRGRIVFPIHDSRGRCVGFGGRVLGDGLPKYLNSPQTPIFDKGGLLYGLHRARSAIRREAAVVIVEGYMDVITAHQNGFENVVASMGTSLTERQLRLLRGLRATVILALDADAAGQAATYRGLKLAADSLDQTSLPYATWLGASSTVDAEVKVFALPEGKDPDALIVANSAAWPDLVAAAKPAVEFWFEAAVQRHDLETASGRSAAAEELLPIVARLADPIQQEIYLSRLARLVGASDRALQAAAARLRPAETARRSRRQPAEAPLPSGRMLRDPLEEHCLALLLTRRVDPHRVGLTVEHFVQSENREVFVALESAEGEAWVDALDEPVREHAAFLIAEAEKHRQYSVESAVAGELKRRDAVRSRATPQQRGGALGRAEARAEADLERDLLKCAQRLEIRRLRDLKQAEAALLAEVDGRGTEWDIPPDALAASDRLRELFGGPLGAAQGE